MKLILGIDHGNSAIKTENMQFVSGVAMSDFRPPMGDYIEYDGMYYILTEKRIPYMWDKTLTDDYFILTLFAMAKEIRLRGLDTTQDVILAVCLPPQHFGSMRNPFRDYFMNRQRIQFLYNGIEYNFQIDDAYVYPQAYAAAYLRYEELTSLGSVFLIDIGGYTVDVLKLRYGKPDMQFCLTLNKGIILLNNELKAKYSAQYDMILDDYHIEDVLNGTSLMDTKLASAITKDAEVYVDDVLRQLKEREIDLLVNGSLFMGGGSILFKRLIENSTMVGSAMYELNVCANARGCKALAEAQYQRAIREA